MTNLKFTELGLSPEMIKAVDAMGFEEASPIQSKAIPVILQGNDIIGQAHTGTGKTAAFGIPVLEKIDTTNKDLQALILCPTRELVVQVTEEFLKLSKFKKNISVVPLYGGQQIERQLKALKKGVQVVVGTPGRTMDHMKRGTIDLSTVKTAVLDEADEMLDMGFRDDIEHILKDASEEKQTIMFSATMDKEILTLTEKFLKSPTIINVAHEKVNLPKIQQIYFEVLGKNKPELLSRLIDLHNIKLSLVFCNTKSQVDELVEVLKNRGYFADSLHGDMNQNQREKVMRGFRNGTVEILVATDVAGRGIDVNDVEAVFNYDLPRDDEDYVHRIGRTGRAGKAGIAFTFVSGKQVYNLKRIEKSNGMLIQRQNVPTIDDIEATKIEFFASKIKTILEEGHISRFVNQVELIMGDDYTSIDIAAALLKMALEKEAENFDDTIDFNEVERYEAPQRNRNSRGRGFRDDRDFSRNNRGDKKRDFSSNRGERSDRKRSFKDDNSFGEKRRSYSDDKDFNRGERSDRKREFSGDRDFNRGERSDRKRSFKDDNSFGEKRRSYSDDKDFSRGEKKSFGDNRGFSGGEKRKFNDDKPFNKDDKRKSEGRKKSFKNDEFESFSFDNEMSFGKKKKSFGESKSFKPKSGTKNSSSKKSDNKGDKKPFKKKK